ncbi:N-6 DNA methylase [Salinibacter ruber]|jgi:type I restriction-modification system DNA methylase subunit|uniref:class I SAM-dependent DNA methyltransferase n=1 Tax=Salinibacter ruber TaxID=146919 RepID=UPI002169E88F|nr:N-6 DNA methylase [Salinibacter ruber]MCS4038723.1 type I restriction-modification system DNA methylase subunit [Salinibacter ruber]
MEISDLYGHFSRCVDLIHNPFRAVNHRGVILPLLFCKIVSDTYRDKRQVVEEKVGSEIAVRPVWYDFAIPDGCGWHEIYGADGSLADSILEGYERLSSANADEFGEILRIDADQLQRLEDGRLESLVKHLSSRNLSRKRTSPEKLGPMFQRLSLRLVDFHRGKVRSFPTPSMSHLLVSLLGPKGSAGRIHDPTCGIGTLLTETARSIRDSEDDLNPSRFSFSGQDADPDLVKIARMNLYANRVDGQLQVGGVPMEPGFARGRSFEHFDFVLSSLIPATLGAALKDRDWRPGLKDWTYEGNDLGLARLIHGISRLKEDGRAVFLIPSSSLTTAGARRLQEHLVGNDSIEAVIGFPEEYGEDEHKRTILVVDRSRPPRRLGQILFMELNRSFFRSCRSNELDLMGEGVDRINAIIADFVEKGGVSCAINTSEMEAKGGSLRPLEHVRA